MEAGYSKPLLNCLEITDMMRKYPDKFKEIFVWEKEQASGITTFICHNCNLLVHVAYIKTLLVTKFSDRENKVRRKSEEAAYRYFSHILEECEGDYIN